MENNILTYLTKEERKLVKGILSNKTSTLFKEGSTCTQIGIIVSGDVEIVSSTPNGRKVVYNTLTTGDVFGANLIFSSDNSYKGDVVLVDKTTLAIIEKNDLIQMLQENKDFMLAYMKVTSDFAKKLNAQIQILSSDSCKDRFLNYLMVNGGTVEIKSIAKAADTIHVTREALSRCITKLIDEKLVSRINKRYKIL